MKSFYAIAATAILTGAAVAGAMAAAGSDTPSRPPGVSADEWAPINNTVGVVLVQGMIPTGAQRSKPQAVGPFGNPLGAALISPVSGYIMVKRGHTWQRLVVIDPVKGPGEAG